MIITGKKIGMFMGFLSVLVTIIMLVSNIFFQEKFSCMEIWLSVIFATVLLLPLRTNKEK